MKLAIARAGAILLFASLLQSCGGGDGDGGGGGGGNQNARLSASTTNVTVAAEPGDLGPIGTVTLTVTNPPEEGLFAGAIINGNGIQVVDVVPTTSTQAALHISFISPSMLQDGTHAGSVEVHVCVDDQCQDEIDGSPVTIQTSYEVSGGVVATLDRNLIELTADRREDLGQEEFVRLTLDRAPETGIYVETNYSSNAITFVNNWSPTPTIADLSIQFAGGLGLGSGTFNDTVTVTVCYDSNCVRQVGGSPFTISTRMIVSIAPEPGFAELEVASRIALEHDVIDAEFSRALNAIVMVGSYPANALYVYDVASATESQQLLNKVPTSVSISPDGLTAAVGHDALISMVDLAAVGQPAAPAPTLLNVAADVLDLVLDSNGFVHALPRVDQWQNIHSVHVATNTEQLSTGVPIYAGALGRLHPAGDYLYTANNGLSPSDIEKWDITSGTADALYDSPYHGDYEMCGNVWFNESGTTIYTPCGNTFNSSVVQANDMVYSGALELSPSDFYGFLIRTLSQSDTLNEIALVEVERYHCEIIPGSGPCYTHFALYESDFLNRVAVYSIGLVTVNDTAYSQQGLFVFHDAAGKKYLISRLDEMPNPDTRYYLSVVE